MKQTLQPLFEYKYTLILSILLFIFSFYYLGYFYPPTWSNSGFLGHLHFRKIEFSLLSTFGLISLISLTNRIPNKIIKNVILILFAFIITVEIVFTICYKTAINDSILTAFLETNEEELSQGFRFGVYFIILLMFLIGLFITSVNELIRVKKQSFYVFIPLFAIHILVLFNKVKIDLTWRKATNDIAFSVSTSAPRKIIILSVCYNELRSISPYIFSDVLGLYYVKILKRYYLALLSKKNNHAILNYYSLDKNANEPSRIFVVIGESSFIDRYHVYGNKAPNTPFLDSVSDGGLFNGVKLYNAISPANATSLSIPDIITFGNTSSALSPFKSLSLMELGKKEGYKVYWISNQAVSGLYDSPFTNIVKNNSDFTQFNINETTRFDSDFIQDAIKKINTSEKQIIFINLRGSHAPYILHRRDNDVTYLAKKVKYENLNYLDYDASIMETDRTLSKLYTQIKRLKEPNGYMFYFPDHGEDIDLMDHAISIPKRNQFNIPFITFTFGKNKLDSLVNQYSYKHFFGIDNFSVIFASLLGFNIRDNKVIKKIKNHVPIVLIGKNSFDLRTAPEWKNLLNNSWSN